MLDLRLIREKPDFVKEALARVGDTSSVDKILELDARRRDLLTKIEGLRSERNSVSKEIPTIKDPAQKETRIKEMRELGERLSKLEVEGREADEALNEILLATHNLPSDDTPDGPDESANQVVGEYGEKPTFDFSPKTHWELGEASGLIDFERGTRISGTRFYILKQGLARLQRALINFMLDVHINEHGYSEVYPPFMVKEHCLYGTGQLPKFGDNLYRDAEEDFWFIPTAEVPVTNMYREEILDGGLLPIVHVAYTACFRREKMSAGKDVRGIKRGHQFDKVEMVAFVKPEDSPAMLISLMESAENIMRKLGLPWRRLKICTGDLSFTAAAKYDLEVWAAGCGEWLEVSSISNFNDFQARRAGIRFRRQAGEKPEFVHTLNGSGLALPRIMIALIENYQTADGKIEIPEALVPYMGGLKVIG